MQDNFEWSIENKSTSLSTKLKEVWMHRDLMWLLVKKDFITFYKQTLLGPLWYFIQPLFTTLIFMFIFGKIGGFKTDGIPRPIFYMSGIILWNYFADCITKTSTVFKDNSDLFGKVYFPRIILPISIVISNLVKFSIQFFFLIIIISYYVIFQKEQVGVNYFIILFPLLIILMAILGLGIGLIISAMTTKYRDLSFLITFGVQILMYTTTVAYPLSSVDNSIQWIVELNPMTAIVETFRYGFLGQATFQWINLIYSFSFTIIMLSIGVFIFNKVERNFIDTI